MEYEGSVDSDQESSQPLAKSTLVLGVCLQSFSFHMLILYRMGLKVIAATADGVSPNMNFFLVAYLIEHGVQNS